MKKISFIGMLFSLIMFTACEKDNYDAPSSTLTGAIMYQGDTLHLKNSEVTLRLYEPGWATSSTTYTTVYVDQYGKFSASLFGGKTYKLIRSSVGAWDLPTASDTITFVANGNVTQNIEVSPYFLIKNTTMQVSNNVVTASFNIEQIQGNAVIEYAQLCLFPNAIIDIANNKVNTADADSNINGRLANVSTGSNTITKTITESELLSYSFIYGRIGIKVQGASALLYSLPIKINLN
ncbi:DUF3823 domain-containing protein [Dysgonomonas macrotermitis]|uniref:DUF3823 domain-containing protein n=1 Tax=Dysgonomonas macrotermitis TaxID=1346286 RepID=A0A1M4SHG3_9BACT|nr:DUF3823 domain-containing protein [Dysgonomonas macrotermitis]SHE31592.1 Protein of unknown function [Dysgonomonas macrotermitis]